MSTLPKPTTLSYLDSIIVELLYDISRLHLKIGDCSDNESEAEALRVELLSYHHELDNALKKHGAYEGMVTLVKDIKH